jgi:hypothetical protein
VKAFQTLQAVLSLCPKNIIPPAKSYVAIRSRRHGSIDAPLWCSDTPPRLHTWKKPHNPVKESSLRCPRLNDLLKAWLSCLSTSPHGTSAAKRGRGYGFQRYLDLIFHTMAGCWPRLIPGRIPRQNPEKWGFHR